MTKAILINDIKNYQFNENNYILNEWDIEPNVLNDEWDEYLTKNSNKILSYLCIELDEISTDELNIFVNILFFMTTTNLEKFMMFYTNTIIDIYKRNNKFFYKIDINLIIDKYITEQIKLIDVNIYKKYIGKKKRISNELIILLINEFWMKPDDMGYFNIHILQFKKRIANTFFLNRIYNHINKQV